VFINDGGIWKLAGLNFSVDVFYRNATDADPDWVRAAIYDSTGLFENLVPGPDNAKVLSAGGTASSYAHEITAFQSDIDQITGVPEPTGLAMLAVAGVVLSIRRRRRA
jgi:hypothetical protein